MLFSEYFTTDKVTDLHNQFKTDYWTLTNNQTLTNWLLTNFGLELKRIGGMELIIDSDYIDIEYLGICLDIFNKYYLNALYFWNLINKDYNSLDDFKLSITSTQQGNNSYENSATNNDSGSDTTTDSDSYKGFDVDNQDNQYSVNNVEKNYSNNRQNQGMGKETNTMTSTSNRQDLTQYTNAFNTTIKAIFLDFRLTIIKLMGRKVIYG